MFHPVSFFIGWRYLRGRSADRFSRFVSYLSTAGITIGVLALVTVLSVMNGFEQQLKTRILGVMPQAVISMNHGPMPNSSTPPKELTSLPHVTHVSPLVRSEAILQSAESLTAGTLLGINPKDYDAVKFGYEKAKIYKTFLNLKDG